MVEEVTRALDGSFYKLKWLDSCGDKCIGCHKYDKEGAAREIAARKDWSLWGNTRISIVRIRPRMSIVKAVRLLTEARKQGVELWMRREDMRDNEDQWRKIDDGEVWLAHKTRFAPPSILDITRQWIVATPQDARKIDSRGKK